MSSLIRLPRVVRDIPHEYISGGLKCGNMGQHIQENKEFKGKDITFVKSVSSRIRFTRFKTNGSKIAHHVV